jgi:hypothetical protein
MSKLSTVNFHHYNDQFVDATTAVYNYPPLTPPLQNKLFNVVSADGYYCSFCGKETSDGVYLVSGPGVHICNKCVDMCNSILEDINLRKRKVEK